MINRKVWNKETEAMYIKDIFFIAAFIKSNFPYVLIQIEIFTEIKTLDYY